MGRAQSKKTSCLCAVERTLAGPWCSQIHSDCSCYSQHKSTQVDWASLVSAINRQDDFMEPNCTLVIKTARDWTWEGQKPVSVLFLKPTWSFFHFSSQLLLTHCVSVGQFPLPECVLAWLLQYQPSMVLQVQDPWVTDPAFTSHFQISDRKTMIGL